MRRSLPAKAGLWVLIAAVLLAVFALYVRPDFMFTLATMVWACF